MGACAYARVRAASLVLASASAPAGCQGKNSAAAGHAGCRAVAVPPAHAAVPVVDVRANGGRGDLGCALRVHLACAMQCHAAIQRHAASKIRTSETAAARPRRCR
eukprot:124427-Chlamydomonas_euryale.AAC.1